MTCFLVAQGGPQRFVKFLEDGMRTEDWVAATERHYGYPRIGKLQTAWNRWVGDGGGNVDRHTAVALGLSRDTAALAAGRTGPVVLASTDVEPQKRNPWWIVVMRDQCPNLAPPFHHCRSQASIRLRKLHQQVGTKNSWKRTSLRNRYPAKTTQLADLNPSKPSAVILPPRLFATQRFREQRSTDKRSTDSGSAEGLYLTTGPASTFYEAFSGHEGDDFRCRFRCKRLQKHKADVYDSFRLV